MPPATHNTPSSSFGEKWKSFYKKEKRLPAAYLIQGPAGSGRHEAASVILQTLLGRTEKHPDLILVEPEKNSIKIEPIRQVIQRVTLKPLEAEHIIVVIKEADALTESAANALLKTLEEPPSYVLFLLITERPERLPATIRSRCQKISFQIGGDTLREQCEALYAAWKEELRPLLQENKASFASASRIAEKVAAQTDRMASLFSFLRVYWRDLAAWSASPDAGTLLIPSAQGDVKKKTAARNIDSLGRDLDLILETERAVEGNVNKTLALERLFARLVI